VARQAWDEVFALLTDADSADQIDVEALPLLADAAYLIGKPEEAVAAWERVHNLQLQAGHQEAAASAVARIGLILLDSPLVSPIQAWIRRARALLEDLPDSPVHGSLAVVSTWTALISGDLDGALSEATRAVEIGTRVGDPAMRALGLNGQARILIVRGQIDEGLALLDESLVAAASGQVDPITAAKLYCSTVCGFQGVGEYERADEWTQALDRVCSTQAVGSFRGFCRVHRAEIKRLRGEFGEAEELARLGYEEMRPYARLELGWPLYELGEIRRRIGDYAGAQDAFLEAHEHGWDPQPGLALLQLSRGDTEAAAASIRNAVANPPAFPEWERPPNTDLRRAPLLAAQVEIAVAAGDLGEARSALAELDRIAAKFGTKALRATVAARSGAVLLAEGGVVSAGSAYEQAARLWREVGAPYESALARMGVAAAARSAGNEQTVLMELRSARSTFERLGAMPDARRAIEQERLIGGDARLETAQRQKKVFMFTDIVQSTNLIEAIGDNAWRHLVHWHNDKLASLVAAGGGQVVQTTGDGFFVSFDSPNAGIECAVAIQRALEEHRRDHGFAPRVRIGLHQAEATPDGPNWSGKGVHAAARIGALAEGDQILASRETAEEADSRVTGSSPRAVSLKGIAEPVEIVAIDWH
jgi:class 3 adenylate cyclase